MAALTFKVGGDTSGLSRAVKSAKGMLSGLAGALKSGALAGGALAIGGLTIAVMGLKKALDLGGRLSDVASNTGLLAGEAMILERALADAGIGGEKLQATIQKMQKSIVEAGDGLITPRRALDELGLSVDGLLKMNPAEQFSTLQEALAGLADPAERSARAMQIFGRSGGELGALFSNPAAMKNAAESVGSQAEILNRSAEGFDRSADILGGVGDKIRSFFVGLADFINPVLLPVLEQFNKVDLAKIGSSFGEALMVIVEAFKTGVLGELLKDSFLYAASFLVNAVVAGFITAGEILLRAASGVGKLITEVFSGENAEAFGKTLVLGLFEEGLQGPISKKFRPEFVNEYLDEKGKEMAESASDALGHMGRVEKAILRDLARGSESNLLDPAIQLAKLEKTIQPLLDLVRQKRKDAAAEEPIKRPDVPVAPEEEEEKDEKGRFTDKLLKPVVTSLGRIGGAGEGGRGVIFRMDRERNRLLNDIAFNTGSAQVAVFA